MPQAGSFVYAHDNRFVIPIVSIQYSDIKCTNLNGENNKNIGIVYADLKWSDRCKIARNSLSVVFDIDNTLVYRLGRVFKYMNTINDMKNIIEIPDMQDLGEKELIALTWRPKRMRQWCLEYDDEMAITTNILS